MPPPTSTNRGATSVASALLLAALALSPLISRGIDPNSYEGGRSRNEQQIEERNSSAIGQIFGKVRASMADIMYMKTDLYLHNGIGYQKESSAQRHDEPPPAAGSETPEHPKDFDFAEKFKEHQEVVKAGGIEAIMDPEDAGAKTVIRTAENDYRSFIGDLERAVQPWQDPKVPHIHTDASELLPWYRVLTLTDPHNIRGYMIGSWWLNGSGNAAQMAEAERFIDEGIKNNPRAFQLHLMKGRLLQKQERYREALPAYRRAGELASVQRPAEGRTAPNWTNYMEEDAFAAMRLHVLAERDYGAGKEAAQALAREYLKIVGPDGVLQRVLDDEASKKPAP